MRFYNVRTGGQPSITLGIKSAGSWNVAPSNLVATSAGTQMTISDIDNYEFFNAAQTSAATDLILLPTAAPVGTVINFFCVSACKVKAVAGTGIGTNGGTDAQGITLVANGLARFQRVSASNWIVTAFTSAGAVSAPTPA